MGSSPPRTSPAEVPSTTAYSPAVTWDGDEYQQRFDRLAASGHDVHGEASFVMAYTPSSVLDAGCGTGRVAIELSHRGVDVVGVDMDASMLATAARAAPQLSWLRDDLAVFQLGRTFDVVLLAGNVPLFTGAGTEAALVTGVARHVRPGGRLIAGFSTDRAYTLQAYDDAAGECGLELERRWATWDCQPHDSAAAYAVSVHHRPL